MLFRSYGLSYADAKDRKINGDQLTAWIAEKRKAGPVALVLQVPKNMPYELPKDAEVIRENNIVMAVLK